MTYDVFISYRRQGGGADARMMYDRLVNAGYTVSFDMDTLKNGNFNEELLKRVAECRNFVVLLSAGCFDRTLEGCNRDNDWLRLEIATALYNNKNIIAVMLPGFSFPEKLPSDIDAVRFKNGPKYVLEYIDGFYDRLMKDFLVKGGATSGPTISKFETKATDAQVEGGECFDLLDVIGDDTAFLRSEALARYESISRLLPFAELNELDQKWDGAERDKAQGDFRKAGAEYLQVLDMCAQATPCSSAFVMRMTADGIDTRQRDWFDKALARAQDRKFDASVDYEYGVGSIYAQGLGVARNAAAAFRWFERAARHGNSQAMAAVGAAYSIGDGVEPDYAEAARWLRKAAGAGIPLAEERLGFLYLNGLGVARDLKKAKSHFEKAAALGNPAACAALGDMHFQGAGVAVDRNAALLWYRKAAADDHPVALRRLAECLFSASPSESDCREALGFCRRAVNQGDVESICVLGQAYENGLGVPVDLKKAAELYERAKTLGSVEAARLIGEMDPQTQYLFGVKSMEGRGCEQDYVVARKWFGRAAGQGHAEALARYGYLLVNGLGGDVNVEKSVKHYETAAEKESAAALFFLGELHFRGVLYKKNVAEAKALYERAAACWNIAPEESKWILLGAFNRLAEMHAKGEECSKDPLMAARLYRFSAQNGSVVGCRNLGMFYRDGVGVSKSEDAMSHWFSKMWEAAETVCACDADGFEALGDALQQGQGVDRNLARAAEFWRKAIQAGGSPSHLHNAGRRHPEILKDGDNRLALDYFRRKAKGGDAVAMANVGVCHRFGYLGVERDFHAALKWFHESAALGCSGAMWSLENMYRNGEGVVQNDDEALNWAIKAAENGHLPSLYANAVRYCGGTRLGRDFPRARQLLEELLDKDPNDVDALWSLAQFYRDGLGVEEDQALVRRLNASRVGVLSRQAEDGDDKSLDALADCYCWGWGVAVDLRRAAELYEEAAKSGNVHAMGCLSSFWRFGVGRKCDLRQAESWAKRFLDSMLREGGAADRGEPNACLSVGDWCRFGYGMAACPKRAFEWFVRAAEKNAWEAMLRLSQMLAIGEGCKRSVGDSREWCKRAVGVLTPLAQNGLASAQRGLADCYARGWCVERSDEKAFELYAGAYEGGDWLAAGRLARMYASGRGVAKDEDKAAELLEKAVARNEGEAECLLGECFENSGWGFETNSTAAVELFRRSASGGDTGGLYNTGRCLAFGIGCAKDRRRAAYWLELAEARHGDFWGYDKKAAVLLKKIRGMEKRSKS